MTTTKVRQMFARIDGQALGLRAWFRAGLLLALTALPLTAAAQDCAAAGAVKSTALTGSWTIAKGAAQTGGSAMFGGSDRLSIQSSGGGITLEIEGRRIALNRVKAGAPSWAWRKVEGVALNSDEFEVVVGCEIAQLARFEGTQKVAGQLVTWRVLVESPREAYVLWSFAGPPPSAGLFTISK